VTPSFADAEVRKNAIQHRIVLDEPQNCLKRPAGGVEFDADQFPVAVFPE